MLRLPQRISLTCHLRSSRHSCFRYLTLSVTRSLPYTLTSLNGMEVIFLMSRRGQATILITTVAQVLRLHSAFKRVLKKPSRSSTAKPLLSSSQNLPTASQSNKRPLLFKATKKILWRHSWHRLSLRWCQSNLRWWYQSSSNPSSRCRCKPKRQTAVLLRILIWWMLQLKKTPLTTVVRQPHSNILLSLWCRVIPSAQRKSSHLLPWWLLLRQSPALALNTLKRNKKWSEGRRSTSKAYGKLFFRNNKKRCRRRMLNDRPP